MFKSVLPVDAPVQVGNRWVFPDGRTLPVVSGGDGPLTIANANATDAMVRRLEEELNERSAFMNQLAATAQDEGRDLTQAERDLIVNAQGRVSEITDQLNPLRESARIAVESRSRVRDTDRALATARRTADGREVEYRSAGEYIADMYHGRLGDRDALERVEMFHRAAAHQTTADNAGLLPQRIVEPVLNGVDIARPLVTAIGPTDLGQGSWAYARVTQHTQVGVQSAEKAELPSRKMLVTLTPITAPTYGGYVNVSRQNIRRTSPAILDMVISDLSGQYAIQTEDACGDDIKAAATAATVTLPNAAGLAAAGGQYGVAQAVWGAAGQAAAALRTANLPAFGPILAVSADRLGILGPLFPPVGPTNTVGSGFTASNVSIQGPQGTISGLTVVMGAGLDAGTVLFFYRSGVRVYEDRYGSLQVDEPSVWGTQVGYAGDFETVIHGGVISIGQAA